MENLEKRKNRLVNHITPDVDEIIVEAIEVGFYDNEVKDRYESMLLGNIYYLVSVNPIIEMIKGLNLSQITELEDFLKNLK